MHAKKKIIYKKNIQIYLHILVYRAIQSLFKYKHKNIPKLSKIYASKIDYFIIFKIGVPMSTYQLDRCTNAEVHYPFLICVL